MALLGCHKEAPAPPVDPTEKLPPATQVGQRTLGCLVNGQPWTPAGNPFAGPLLSAVYLNGRLGISASRVLVVNGRNSFHRLGFSIQNVHGAGTFLLADSTSTGSYEDFDTRCTYQTFAAQSGTVVLTKFDPVNRIVSGRFNFALEAPGCGRVEVSDGRFDVRF